MIGRRFCVFALAAVFASAHAQESSEAAPVPEAVEQQIIDFVAKIAPGMPVDGVSETVVPGLYELISGIRAFYLTSDGRYLIEGSIIDLKTQTNLSENRRAALEMSVIEQVPVDQMLVFEATPSDSERFITVFTDSDCGYCQKLHAEIDEITDAGIEVRYMLFPRAGLDSASALELESVWCSSDPQDAMTVAKSGGVVDRASCDNPIRDHVLVAQEVGLSGTPLIYLDTGVKIPGYRPASELVAEVLKGQPLQVD